MVLYIIKKYLFEINNMFHNYINSYFDNFTKKTPITSIKMLYLVLHSYPKILRIRLTIGLLYSQHHPIIFKPIIDPYFEVIFYLKVHLITVTLTFSCYYP